MWMWVCILIGILFLILYYVVKFAVKNGVLAAWETIKTELPAAAPADWRAELDEQLAKNKAEAQKAEAKGENEP